MMVSKRPEVVLSKKKVKKKNFFLCPRLRASEGEICVHHTSLLHLRDETTDIHLRLKKIPPVCDPQKKKSKPRAETEKIIGKKKKKR